MDRAEILAEHALPAPPAWTRTESWLSGVPDLPPRTARDLLRCATILAEAAAGNVTERARADVALDLPTLRTRLGGTTLAALALALWLPATLPEVAGYATRRGWRHGFAVAVVASSLAPDDGGEIWRDAMGEAAARLMLAGRGPMAPEAAVADPDRALIELGALIAGEQKTAGGSRANDARTVAAWLLAQKRMLAPPGTHDPSLAPATLAGLGLGPDALVAVIAALSASVERARRLSTIALERR